MPGNPGGDMSVIVGLDPLDLKAFCRGSGPRALVNSEPAEVLEEQVIVSANGCPCMILPSGERECCEGYTVLGLELAFHVHHEGLDFSFQANLINVETPLILSLGGAEQPEGLRYMIRLNSCSSAACDPVFTMSHEDHSQGEVSLAVVAEHPLNGAYGVCLSVTSHVTHSSFRSLMYYSHTAMPPW